jgi:subfamily B ATP-binding cassette protein MsbA
VEIRTKDILWRVARQGWDYKWLTLLVTGLTFLVSGLVGLQAALLAKILKLLSSIEAAWTSVPAATVEAAAQVAGNPMAMASAIAELKSVSLLILALALPVGAAAYGAMLAGQYLANRCMRDLRNRFLAHIIRLELSFHVELERGDLMQRMTGDLNALFSLQTTLFSKLFQKPFEVLALLGFLIYLSWQFTIGLVVVMLPIGALVAWGLRKVKKRSREANQSMATSLVVFEQITAGVRVIKAMGSTEREVSRYEGSNQELFNLRQRMVRARSESEGLTHGSVMLVAAAGMGLGALLFDQRWIMPMTLIVALGVVGRMANCLREIQRAWGDVLEAIPSAARVYELFDRKPAVVDRPAARPCPPPVKAITLEQVRFRYAPDSEEVLRGIDLEIPVGRTVALVGESGGGKSTILDLIPRFHDVTGGRIAIDGTDIRDLTLESLAHQFAIVQQDSFLFNDTVFNNIRYGRPDATRDEVEQAALRAHVHHAILALEGGKGYDSPVGDRGERLSGGQRQRVAIARALLRDAPILLLDEPTSALDADSESHVQAALKELMKDRTTIVVAHRLATVQHADRIYVLAGKGHPSRGMVLEQGTHAALVAQGGEYARLVQKQQLAT